MHAQFWVEFYSGSPKESSLKMDVYCGLLPLMNPTLLGPTLAVFLSLLGNIPEEAHHQKRCTGQAGLPIVSIQGIIILNHKGIDHNICSNVSSWNGIISTQLLD